MCARLSSAAGRLFGPPPVARSRDRPATQRGRRRQRRQSHGVGGSPPCHVTPKLDPRLPSSDAAALPDEPPPAGPPVDGAGKSPGGPLAPSLEDTRSNCCALQCEIGPA